MPRVGSPVYVGSNYMDHRMREIAATAPMTFEPTTGWQDFERAGDGYEEMRSRMHYGLMLGVCYYFQRDEFSCFDAADREWWLDFGGEA